MQEYKVYSTTNIGLFTNLINGLKTIEKDINEKQRQEAEDQGLVLLSRSTNPNMNFYKFEDCRHTTFLQATHVRRANFKCNQCFINSVADDCNNTDASLLHNLGGSYYKVRLDCGHVVNRLLQSIKNNKNEKCIQCFNELVLSSCDRYQYEFIEHVGLSNRKIRFKECGHEKTVVTSQIIKGNVVCRDCIEQEYLELFKEQGLTLVSNLEDYRYKLFKLPCSCEKKLRIDHAADGSFLCGNCSDSHYTKPSFVYLLKITYEDFSWLKLGFAKNLRLRKNGYGLVKGCEIEEVSSVYFDKGYEAMLFEKALHAKYKSRRLDKNKMTEYHTFSGQTECYSVDLLSELDSELKSLTV